VAGPESADQRLALNVRALRDRKGLSQRDLAAEMKRRGHAWHQQTVGRVESAAQSVRFSELMDLAAVLETSLDRFTWASAEANATEALYSAGAAVRRSASELASAVFRLLADRGRAEIIAKGAGGHDTPRVAEAREDLLGAIAGWDLDQAVADGVSRYQELTEGSEEQEELLGQLADAGLVSRTRVSQVTGEIADYDPATGQWLSRDTPSPAEPEQESGEEGSR
jgi:transcriptional regulator with XRE-family HTH domain